MRALVLVTGLLSALYVGCGGGGGGFTCAGSTPCGAGGTIQTCCNRRQCEYRANGRTFECESSTNCSSAAAAVADYCGS